MNLSDWVDRRAAFTPDKTAVRFAGEQTSYAALADQIARLAGVLHDPLGLGRGDRVAFLGLNCPPMLALVFACARVGAILVPVNWRLAAAEVRYVLEHARPGAIVVGPEFVDTVESLRPDLARLRTLALDVAPPGWLSLTALLDGARPQAGLESDVG